MEATPWSASPKHSLRKASPVLRHAGVLVLFGLLTAAMTWPLIADLERTIPHPGDPFIVTWFLDWTFHAATHNGAEIFHGNIFHPLRYTIAFSENMLGIAPLTWPLLAAGVAPLSVYNIAAFLAFVLAGYGATLLGRHVTGSWLPAIVAGIFFAFVPWRFTHLTHLQHLWTVWLPLLVLATLRLAEEPTRRRAVLFGIAFVFNGLTNLHWLAFGAAAVPLAAVCAAAAHERLRDRRFWSLLVGATVVASLALVPVLMPYWVAGRMYAFRGDPGETLSYSAVPSDWLISSLHNRVYRWWTNDGSVEPERWLFPGLLAPLLAMVGLTMWRRGARQRAAISAGIALLALGFLGSLGLNSFVGRLLFELPLYKGIRAPARWAMIAYLGVALLTALGVARLASKQRVVAVVLSALLLIELRAAPIRWYLTTGETPPVYTWLRDHDPGGAIVELPMRQDDVYAYMLHATVHHRRLINGVSGFKPSHYAELEEMSTQVPIPDAFLARLTSLGTRLVVVHGADPALREWTARETARGRMTLVRDFANGDSILAIGVSAKVAAPAYVENVTAGVLTSPGHWTLVEGALPIRGRARSAQGIARVDLLFDNARDRVPAALHREADGAVIFDTTIARRPDFIRSDTDLQVEIVDGRGKRTRLPQVWLQWYRSGEERPRGPLPQTKELGPLRELR